MPENTLLLMKSMEESTTVSEDENGWFSKKGDQIRQGIKK